MPRCPGRDEANAVILSIGLVAHFVRVLENGVEPVWPFIKPRNRASVPRRNRVGDERLLLLDGGQCLPNIPRFERRGEERVQEARRSDTHWDHPISEPIREMSVVGRGRDGHRRR
jgi:hypothetical protein